MDKLPRILIGVLGYTGSGKSSLINALVDQETLLPCSAMRSSTSVAVEIAYNQSKNPQHAFRAEVEFITAQEWADEYQILVSDIQNRPPSESLTLNSNTDAGLAFAKLSAIYPGAPISKLVELKPDELEKVRDISNILGQSILIHESTAVKFCETINVYIDSSNKGTGEDEFANWPLVRLVKVFIKSDILKNGLVLVDLPGLGDSNVGRTQVAEDYIKKLRHMWVVADIVRAIDDRVANELMSRSFRRALVMDGRYHENFVTFIMTKTDQLTTHEVINSLSLDSTLLKEEVKREGQLEKELQTMRDQLNDQKHLQKQCKKALKKFGDASDVSAPEIRKRSLEEAESAVDEPQVPESRKQILLDLNAAEAADKELNTKISTVKKTISALNTKMRGVCIKERNRYTSDHLEQDFRTGQGEFMEKLEAGKSNVSYPKSQGVYQTLNCPELRLKFSSNIQKQHEHILCIREGVPEATRSLSTR
jgi:GTP-binding protein EngB required for normal cell division